MSALDLLPEVVSCVKEEPECEHTARETTGAGWLFTYQVQVKEEPECSEGAHVKEPWEGGVSAATSQPGLYADHEVLGEVVLGPKQLQRPSVAVLYAAAEQVPRECRKFATAATLAATGDPTSILGLEKTVPQIINTIQVNPNNTYVCDDCSKEFNKKRSLIQHIRAHERKSIQKSEILRKPFPCGICKKVFTRSDHLQIHLRSHSGFKPYNCELCSKNFADHRTLRTHKRIHTGDKPFSCQTCKRKFTQLGNLKRHTRIHTGEKPFCCDECSKLFISASDLNRHKRIHTGVKPYNCEICKKGFAISHHMKRHIEIHSREKPFSCDICEMRFNRRCHLNAHKRSHKKRRSYVRKTNKLK